MTSARRREGTSPLTEHEELLTALLVERYRSTPARSHTGNAPATDTPPEQPTGTPERRPVRRR